MLTGGEEDICISCMISQGIVQWPQPMKLKYQYAIYQQWNQLCNFSWKEYNLLQMLSLFALYYGTNDRHQCLNTYLTMLHLNFISKCFKSRYIRIEHRSFSKVYMTQIYLHRDLKEWILWCSKFVYIYNLALNCNKYSVSSILVQPNCFQVTRMWV